MVICLEQCADLHMAQLMPLPLTVSCFSKIQIGFTFLVLAHLGSPGKRAVKRVCVCDVTFLKEKESFLLAGGTLLIDFVTVMQNIYLIVVIVGELSVVVLDAY